MTWLLMRIVLSSKLRVFLLLIFYIQTSLIADSPFASKAFGEELSDAIIYKEWPEGGSKEKGRKLKAERYISYGIDINSHVNINVDENKLGALFVQYQPPEKINSRLLLIKELSGNIKGLMVDLKKLYVTWDEAETNPTNDAVKKRNDQIMMFNLAMSKVIKVLKNTIIERLMHQDKSAADAKKEMEAIVIPMLKSDGYDWNAIMGQVGQEIKFLDDELEKASKLKKVADDQPRIKIMAHILRSTEGMGEPIYLPGHNTVEACRPTPVPKVTFNVPDYQKELFNESAINMNEAKSLGEALTQSLEAQGELLKKSLTDAATAVGSALSEAQKSKSTIEFWGDENNIKLWYANLSDTVKKSQEGKNLSEKLNDLPKKIRELDQEINTDIELMNSFSKQKSGLETATPSEALQTILATLSKTQKLPAAISPITWKSRKAAIEELKERFNISPELIATFEKVEINGRNPITDFKSISTAIDSVDLQITSISPEVSAWIKKTLYSQTGLAVTNLQPVLGQEIHRIENKQLDTSFDLKTICGGRNEFETIRVTYQFFQGEDELSAGWYNDFQIRKFGYKDTVVASVAVVNQQSTETYKPTASLSWIIDYTFWPKDSEKGVGSGNEIIWLSGAGITTMALDQDQTQDTELGLALTVSFLNNKILVGYGADLQAKDNREFWFFSINLFETPGMFNGSASQSK